MIFMGLNSDYNARINLKLKFIVKSIIKVLTKHLILISILNLIISLCHNYAIDRDSNNQLNIVAHLLRGTFVSSVPSCITLSLLIFFKEHSLNNYMYKEWNFLNIICVILTFYSIFYTKTVFSKDYGNNIYDVLYVASISYILQKRFNTKKMGIHDFQHCINSETKNIIDLIQKDRKSVV